MVASVTDNAGALVALHITHVTPAAEKSKVQSPRVTIRGPHDWRSRGAFRIGPATAPDVVIAEGVEDAISAIMAGADCAHACLGVNALGRAELPIAVSRVIVARDDDAPGSPASLALGRGVARLLGQGHHVLVTARAGQLAAGAKDINDLLQINVGLARRQLDEASGLHLLGADERGALLDEISRLPDDVYETRRKIILCALNWRAKALDDDRREKRAQRARCSDGGNSMTNVVGLEPWPDPVTDVGTVLDAGVAQLKRFLIVPDPTYFDSIALWCAHTHLVRNQAFGVGFTPRLAFQSPIKRCGKSTALKCSHLMSHNARTAASITSSALFRAVEAHGVSLMVDEADNVFKNANPDLLAIMNSGADRLTAKVMRAEVVEEGQFEPREFNTFAAIALTSIRQLPDTLQDRSIVLSLKRATQAERPERLTLRSRGPLIDIGRQLARWATGLSVLPDPDMPPALFNRVEDKWFVIFQVAHVAGGDWPERCCRAALADLAREEMNDADGGRNADLLSDVWQVFHEENVVRIHTEDLCRALNFMSESPWSAANQGRQVDGYYLRCHLADFVAGNAEELAPRKWRNGPGSWARGYHELHFQDAFDRYLGRGLPSAKQKQARGGEDSARSKGSHYPPHPSHPSQADESKVNSDTYAETNAPVASVSGSASENEARRETHAETDGSGTSVSENHGPNHTITEKEADETDEADTLTSLRAPALSAPPAAESTLDNQNDDKGRRADDCVRASVKPNGSGASSDSVVSFPRGAQGRRRRDPGARPAQ